MMYLLYVGRAALYDLLYGSSDVLYDIVYEGTDVLSRACCLPCFPMFLGMHRGVDRGFRLKCSGVVGGGEVGGSLHQSCRRDR